MSNVYLLNKGHQWQYIPLVFMPFSLSSNASLKGFNMAFDTNFKEGSFTG